METVGLFAVFPHSSGFQICGLRSDSRQIGIAFDILIRKYSYKQNRVNMFRMLRVFNIVGRVQNIVPKRYYSFVQSSEADQRNRLSDYTLTKDGLKSLSRFFEVKPKLLATVQYSDEIAWDSLNGESFVLLASGKQQECLDNITSNVGSLSCDDLILMLIAIDSLEIPLHYRVFDAIQMEIKKRLSECNSNFPFTSQIIRIDCIILSFAGPFDKNGLNSLANLSAFLNKRRDHINKFFIGAELHSNAMKILPQCSSLDEISKISQCIGNMNILTTLQNFLDYKGVVSKIFAAERVDWLKDGSKIFNVNAEFNSKRGPASNSFIFRF